MSDYSKAKEEYDSMVAREEYVTGLESQVKDLSLIIRRMNRYAEARKTTKIIELFEKCQHLLSKVSPKKGS
jgi:hypothetical protein